MPPHGLENLVLIALGFAVGGLLSSIYQLLAERPASFEPLYRGPSARAYAHVPFLVFAAPFLILRAVTVGGRGERRDPLGVALATAFASFWSLMSGTVLVFALGGLGLL